MPLIHYYNDANLARIPPWFTLTQIPVIYISKALDQASQQVRCKYRALHHQCQLLIQGTHLLLFPSSIGGRTQNYPILWDFEIISTFTYMSPWKESRGSTSFHHGLDQCLFQFISRHLLLQPYWSPSCPWCHQDENLATMTTWFSHGHLKSWMLIGNVRPMSVQSLLSEVSVLDRVTWNMDKIHESLWIPC